MLLLMTLLALTVGEPAAVAPPPAQPAQPAPAAEKEETVCITKAKVGTRFKDRVCFNKAEYARRQEEERKALDRMQRIPVNCKQTGGC